MDLISFFFPLNYVEDDFASSSVVELPDMGPTIKSNATSQMDAAIAALSVELSKLRTGRASSGEV